MGARTTGVFIGNGGGRQASPAVAAMAGRAQRQVRPGARRCVSVIFQIAKRMRCLNRKCLRRTAYSKQRGKFFKKAAKWNTGQNLDARRGQKFCGAWRTKRG